MGYTDILLAKNWTNLSDSITPVSGIYTIGFNVLNSYAPLATLDYASDHDYYGPVSAYEINFRDITSVANSITTTALPTIFKQSGYTNDYSAFFGDVAHIVFQSGGNNAIIIGATDGAAALSNRIFTDDDMGGATVTGTSYGEGAYGDIWFNEDWTEGWSGAAQGSVQFLAVLHEIGHAMGLDHPSNSSSPTSNHKYTIMADETEDTHPDMASTVFPSGLQLWDIAAIQEIYGRNYDVRDTSTTYKEGQGFASSTSTPFIYTIWDGGGTDTIDASGYSDAVQIDLRQGAFSSIGKSGIGSDAVEFDDNEDKGNVAIAYYAVIENAVSTDENDILIGNAWDNTLNGGEGNDELYGDGVVYDRKAGFGTKTSEQDSENDDPADDKSGDDILNGGADNDILYGGKGDDTLNGGADTDTADYSRYEGYTLITMSDAANAIVDKYDGQRNSNGTQDSTDNLYSIEKFVFGKRGGELIASEEDDEINTEGDGIVHGGDGSDTLWHGSGNGFLSGGNGADRYILDYTSTGTKYIVDGGTDNAVDTITIENVTDANDIAFFQFLDDLFIFDISSVIPRALIELVDFFKEGAEQVDTLEIDDGSTITTENLITLTSHDITNSFSANPGWFATMLVWFGVTITGWWDPLAIDLDGDGIERIANGRYFDLDNNGLAENTAWLHGNDGFLAIDLNENGRIDNGGELFGTATVDGFSALAAYDSNSDGVINSSDSVWSDLIIWQDKNSDGQTQSDEMLTLASFNITGIDVENVTATGSTANVNGGIITHTGTVTTTTGTMDIANLNFIRDTTNTRAAVDYDMNIETLFLPDVRGYSNVMGLRDALNVLTTADTANGTTLLEKMQSIASHSLTDFFANYSTIVETLEEAMFQWAGVVDVSPTSRGIYLSDARIVEFFEEYFGQGFVDRNEWGTNPGIVHAQGIEGLWHDEIFTRLKANIFMQMAPAALFEAGISYNYAEDGLTLADGASKELSLDVLEALDDAASTLSTTAEREAFWIGVLDFLHSVRNGNSFGASNYVGLTSTEITAVDTAITDSDSSLDFDGVLYRLQNPLGETIEGTSGNDTGGSQINGTANDDTLSGLAGADTIDAGAGNDTVYGHNHDSSGDDNANDRVYGMAGNDTIYGGGGHDTLDGGAGSDHIYGGDGNDVLVDGYRETVASQNLLEGEAGDDSYYISYAQIDSNSDVESVYIIDSSGSDSIRFRNGNSDDLGDDQKYLLSNLSFKRLIDHDLIITALNGNNATTITIADQLSDLNNSTGLGIEIIRLWNGSSYYSLDLKDYLLNYSGAMVTWGTNAADVINGITIGSLNDDIRGFDGDDVIHGNAGNDVIRGDGGNDTLYGDEGNDTLDGGSGYSILYGGDGNDTLAGGGELYGEAGNDTLVGSSTIDVLSGLQRTSMTESILSFRSASRKSTGFSNSIIPEMNNSKLHWQA